MKTIISVFIGLLAFTANAALYKWVDENGEVVYSDKPPQKGAEELKPPPLMTTPAVKYKAQPKEEAKKSKEDIINYTSFSITSPTENETIRDNSGNISVSLTIDPPLASDKGHYINILVDGKPKISKSTSLTHTLTYIDRGTHTLSAEIRGASGNMYKSSNSVTIHLHRFSKLHKKPATGFPPAAPNPGTP